MNISLEQLNLILKQKEQWYCDRCGEIIQSDKDGMLEWDSSIEPEEEVRTAKNFRIVHHITTGLDCQTPRQSRRNLSDGHLHWYTGSGGLSELLDLYERNKVNPTELNTIIRRLHVDLYEEARPYMQKAKEDGYSYDPHDVGDYSQQELVELIFKYGNRY
jgi:hypothetical protein